MAVEIYVGNLNPDTTEKQLRDAFRSYGEVTRCHIGQSRNRETPDTNFGFVIFESPDDARDAVEGLNGIELNRNVIEVQFAKRGRDRFNRGGSSSRGGYYGGGSTGGGSYYGSSYSRGGGGGGGGGGRSRFSNTQCYKCGADGHISRYCTSTSNGAGASRPSRRYDDETSRYGSRRSRSRSQS